MLARAGRPVDPDLSELGCAASTAVRLDREIVAEGGLYHFVRLAWRVIETSPFADGWHLREMCAHLEAVTRGGVKRLVIALPPGLTKSLITCVFWPAWTWIRDPRARWIYASCDLSLALRDARKCRDLIRSEWFSARWGDRVRLDSQVSARRRRERADAAQEYYTSHGGMRFTTTPRGKAIGWHADYHVVDDPHQALDAYSPGELEYVGRWWDDTMATRARDRQQLRRVVQHQRIAQGDLGGRCLDQGYVGLVLPMRFDPDRACVTPVGGDRRTRRGELVCPGRYDDAAEAALRAELGRAAARAQLDQDPDPPGGRVFDPDDFRLWRALPRERGVIVDSWDGTTGKRAADRASSDPGRSWVVGQRWLFVGLDAYLLHEVRGQWEFAEQARQVERLALTPGPRGERPRAVLVEDAAAGPEIARRLASRVPDLELVPPRGSKTARASAITPDVEAGRVYLPDAPWRGAWLAEIGRFPARPNDRGDAMSQALSWEGRDTGSSLLEQLRSRRPRPR